MTTIAYRNGILAADTRCTIAGASSGSINKIARRYGGALAGAAGNAVYNFAFLEWFVLNDEKVDPPKAQRTDDSIDRGIIFFPDGRIHVYEPDGKFMIKAEYHALGSGTDVALGAMFMGATAEQAVRAAILHDNGTGGEVLVLKHHP